MSSSESKTCLALLAEGTEELELVGTVDVLRRAGFNVTIAGVNGSGCVKCSRDVAICADVSLSDVVDNEYDVIVLPGGLEGVKKFIQSDLVKNLLTKQENSDRVIAAICAAPTVLKAFSLGLRKTLTSYPSLKHELVSTGNYTYSENNVVVDGNLITSRGPGTAIDFGLAIVRKLLGEEVRTDVASRMVYE